VRVPVRASAGAPEAVSRCATHGVVAASWSTRLGNRSAEWSVGQWKGRERGSQIAMLQDCFGDIEERLIGERFQLKTSIGRGWRHCYTRKER